MDEATEGIDWEDPPPSIRGGKKGKHVPFFEALREHPGKWAVFSRGKRNGNATTRNVRQGIYKGVEAGEFDATYRTIADGTQTVYVRYIGDGFHGDGAES